MEVSRESDMVKSSFHLDAVLLKKDDEILGRSACESGLVEDEGVDGVLEEEEIVLRVERLVDHGVGKSALRFVRVGLHVDIDRVVVEDKMHDGLVLDVLVAPVDLADRGISREDVHEREQDEEDPETRDERRLFFRRRQDEQQDDRQFDDDRQGKQGAFEIRNVERDERFLVENRCVFKHCVASLDFSRTR